MLLDTDQPQTESDIRTAKRVACIAESMDIIRTLNSHNIIFDVKFNATTIGFNIILTQTQLLNIIPIVGNNGRIFGMGAWSGIAFAW